MTSANGKNIRAAELSLSPSDSYSMKGASYDNEKQLPNPEPTQSKSNKMLSVRQFFLILLVTVLLAVTIVSSSNVPSRAMVPSEGASAEEQQAFRDLLNTVEPSCLHDVLHEHLKTKYKHGVFQEDKNALEAVHRQEPAVAFSLVELAKRQTASSNGTVASTSSTAEATASSTDPATTSTTPSATPDSTTSATSSATSVQSTATASTDPTSTQTTRATTSKTSSTPEATTSTAPSTTAETSSSPTTADKITTTSAHTTVSNSHSVTTKIVYTTTEANGAVVTATSTTVVPAPEGDQTSTGSAANTDGATLQTAGGGKIGWELSVFLGAIVMAAMWTL